MRALRIFWIGGHAHAGADIEWNVLNIECRAPHHIAQTFGDDHRRVLVGLRQQDHEFVTAISERVVDQAQLDRIGLQAGHQQHVAMLQVAVSDLGGTQIAGHS